MTTTMRDFGTVAANVQPEVIDASAIEIIGIARRAQYARINDGRELRIGKQLLPVEMDNPLRDGQLQIREVVTVHDKARQPWPDKETRHYIANVVPSGTYERAKHRDQAREADKRRQANPPILPIDALAVIPALAFKPPAYFVGDAPAMPLLAGDGIAIPGRPAITGPEAILDWLRSKGVTIELSADRGFIIPRSARGSLAPEVRAVIADTAPLLVGALGGDPVPCQVGRHKGKTPPPAVTLLVGGAGCCAEHLAAEAEA